MNKLASTIHLHLGIEQIELPKVVSEPPLKAPQTATPVLPPNIAPELAKAVEILQNPANKWWRRADAARTLAESKDPIVLTILETYLNDADVDVQQAAERAIKQINNPRISRNPKSVSEGKNSAKPNIALEAQSKNPIQPVTEKHTGIQALKIVVTGPFSSGKTKFIHSISDIETLSSNQATVNAHIGLDLGRVTIGDDLICYLFGTPGQRHLDAIWEVLTEGMSGFIVMVDSTKPENFGSAKSILEKFRSFAPVPYVLAANKQDHHDAWSSEDIRVALRIEQGIKVLPCVALDKKSAKNILSELVYSIRGN